MVGYHCSIKIGGWLEAQPFFGLFEMTWLVMVGWLPGITKCLAGAII